MVGIASSWWIKKYPQLKIASLLHNGHKYPNKIPTEKEAVQSQLLTEHYHKNTQLKQSTSIWA